MIAALAFPVPPRDEELAGPRKSDREHTVSDVMRQVARHGGDPPVLLREGQRDRSSSLVDLASRLLQRRTSQSGRV